VESLFHHSCAETEVFGKFGALLWTASLARNQLL